ncbi:hypothetical protein O0L34_g16271 [Tuta absoluta]|nr:hypothetical protein O0L34_g16271 [Tuta absoluta]
MISIRESNNKNVSYVDMMKSLANIKITNDAEITVKICRDCCKQLQAAYDFKLLIERSDATLNGNLNKLKFDNINDIKMEIEINFDDKKPNKELINVVTNVNDKNKFCFGDTIITKVRNIHDEKQKYFKRDNVCLKPVPVLEFLKTIPDETDNDTYSDVDFQNYDGDSCGVNSDDMMMIPLKTRRKTQRKTKHKLRSGKKYKCEAGNKNEELNNLDNNCYDMDTDCEDIFISPEKLLKKKRTRKKYSPQREHQVCIKPIKLKNLKLLYSKKEFGSNSEPRITKSKPKEIPKRVCPHCGIMSTYLHNHIKMHEGVRKYKCDKCDKAFFTKGSLNSHRKYSHGARQFKCSECMMAFRCKDSLKSHLNKHSDKLPFVCEVCSKAFKRTQALRRHRLMHNAANKKVPCDQCSMTFYNKNQLKHHLRIHTRERPYNCEICSQPYSYKRDFNQHCLKKHGILLKRRLVKVMNEEVMLRERMLMRELVLRVQGVINDDKPVNPFESEGAQAQAAFESAIEAIQTRQISIDFS